MIYTNIFDTHSHYDDEAFDSDREELILSLKDKGVVGAVSCGCDIPSTAANRDLAHKFNDFYFAAGFHPENLEKYGIDDLGLLDEYLNDEKCVAVGEIGLDYHWMESTKEKQKAFFESQIEIAKNHDLPVIVHDREAHGDTLDILKATKPKGVLHCFSGSKEMAREIIKLGMYIGLNGVATFKNARKSLEVVKEIPLDRLVLETDCPYLAPEPHRGKRNDSSYIPFIAERIGELLGMSAQEVLDQTYQNAKKLYNI
ncbi:TatD family hydrolase [uncultured Eubacterium sp.]|uniref:TatD family hydrolase n=1 Tax=uncultured Eubacterium sp. TaxID=165185 RepID=UPI00345C3BA5